jgi:hypothetical protein
MGSSPNPDKHYGIGGIVDPHCIAAKTGKGRLISRKG